MLSSVAYISSWFIQGWGFNTSDIIQTYFLHINFYFAAGVFLYTRFEELKSILPDNNGFYIFSITISLVLMFALNSYFGGATKFSCLLAAVFSFLLIFWSLNKNIVVKPLAFIGQFSYSLYITHVATILLVMSILSYFSFTDFPVLNRWLWLVAIPFCMAVSYMAWLFVEKNAQKLKKFYL